MFLFNTHDPKQTTRLRRFLFGFSLYVVAFLIGLVSMYMDVERISWAEFWWVVLLGGSSQIGLFIAIRSRFSERFHDPSLTLTQMLIGMGLLTYVISLVQDVRGALLNGYVMVVLFGSFNLKRRDYIFVTLFAMSAYALVILFDFLSPPPGFDVKVNLFQWVILAFVMAICTYIGSYLQDMREGLKASRDGLIASHKEITKRRDEIESAHRELQDALRQLSQLAVRDDLTGLFNRKQFEQTLRAQVSLARTSKTRLGLLVLDIDHFKSLNEKFGRDAGDKILHAFSNVARSCLRRTDYIARFGGEEFAVLLPNANENSVRDCAERIRDFVLNINFDSIEPNLRITVSLGGALMDEDEDPDHLLQRVNHLLLTAKEAGRNRILLA